MSGVDAIKEREVSIDLVCCAAHFICLSLSLSGQFGVIAYSRTSRG